MKRHQQGYLLAKFTPNDAELGGIVRNLLQKHLEKVNEAIADANSHPNDSDLGAVFRKSMINK